MFTGDAIISDSGSLLVAAAPVGNPSTVVVWEVTAWDLSTPGNTWQYIAGQCKDCNGQYPITITP